MENYNTQLLAHQWYWVGLEICDGLEHASFVGGDQFELLETEEWKLRGEIIDFLRGRTTKYRGGVEIAHQELCDKVMDISSNYRVTNLGELALLWGDIYKELVKREREIGGVYHMNTTQPDPIVNGFINRYSEIVEDFE